MIENINRDLVPIKAHYFLYNAGMYFLLIFMFKIKYFKMLELNIWIFIYFTELLSHREIFAF